MADAYDSLLSAASSAQAPAPPALVPASVPVIDLTGEDEDSDDIKPVPVPAEAVTTEPQPSPPTAMRENGGASSGGSLGSYVVRTSFRRARRR